MLPSSAQFTADSLPFLCYNLSLPFCIFVINSFSSKHANFECFNQGALTEEEGSIQLTFLYQLFQISYFCYCNSYLLFTKQATLMGRLIVLTFPFSQCSLVHLGYHRLPHLMVQCDHKLQNFIIIQNVRPLQAFPGQYSVCGYDRTLPK